MSYTPANSYAELQSRMSDSRRAEIEELVISHVQGSLGNLSKKEVLAAPAVLIKNAMQMAISSCSSYAKTIDEKAYVLSFVKRRFRDQLVHAGLLKEK